MRFTTEAKACIASILVACLSTMLCTSCASQRSTREMVWIAESQITEAELQRRGVHYEKYEFDGVPGYCIEVSALNKFCDYTIEATGKVVSFAAKGIVVVGVLILMVPELWMPSSANVSRGTRD